MLKLLKKLLRFILIVLILYSLYFFVGAIFIFLKDYTLNEESRLEAIDTVSYYSEEVGPDRATILEDGRVALNARFQLVEQAQESIKIANFKLESGEVSDVLYALLIEKAMNGVEVQLLIDGVLHNLFGVQNELYWALATTPNIEVRFYDAYDLLRPWTFNNRLHDKIFIVDDMHAITGGRNIGDNYYLKNKEGQYAYDRDVYIYTKEENKEISVIKDLNMYYSELWSAEVTDYATKEELLDLEEQGQEGQEELLGLLESKREAGEFYLEADIDLEENSHETNNISLIHNPIQRFKKDPIILQTLNELMLEAEDLIVMQTPYLILNSELKPLIRFDEMEASTHILTNSETSSNNPALPGFLNLLDDTLPVFNQIYGFQGDGSIHAKSYVIDNRLSLIGSFNLDPRSSFLSTENLVIIDSPTLADELSNNIISLMENSRIYKAEDPFLPESVEEPETLTTGRRWMLRFMRVLVLPFDELL